MTPRFVRRMQKRMLLHGWEKRSDAGYIRSRVEFYCPEPLTADTTGTVRKAALNIKECGSRYYFDLMRFLNVYPADTLLRFMPGDVWHNAALPTIAKARRLDANASHMTLLKLNHRRHYVKMKDGIPFHEKKPVLFFRGDIYRKPSRIDFFRKYFNSPHTDLGDTSREASPGGEAWLTPHVSIEEHLKYQFILCLEGNDVATAVQWAMASNCVPVMPRPTVETWFMHSRLEPGIHYIEIAADFSDVEEKISYYTEHQEEAELISRRSREWAAQFDDARREKIISHLVLERYFGK